MVLHKGNSENEVYDEFYNAVFVRLNIMGFINNGIDKQVIQTSKRYVCNFLQKNTISLNQMLKIRGII